MRGTLGLLTIAILNIVVVYINQEPTYLLTNVMKNIIYMGSKMLHEREEIIKAEEEADATHEFITNLPNDLVGKLVRESPYYRVYGNNMFLLL
ncbi:hypothetical protein V1477_001412 [Vespula maculifrons]|uniref:Uncharacterized protein n=1 Tax=Vespula maculifrons TaxID=7453 RepID=A0ABD2CYZ7_VESMC